MGALGEMTEQVSFVRRARLQTSDGGYTTTDTTLATVFAAVQPVEAREPEQTGRLHGSTSYLVRIHADDKPASLTTGDFVGWLSAPGAPVGFNIRGIRQARVRGLFLEIVCEAGAVDFNLGNYSPSLDFSKAQNSMYVGQVV